MGIEGEQGAAHPSAVERVRGCLAHIERFNPHVNAVVTLDSGGALRAAQSADQAGPGAAPLHGVPITVKDAFETAGMRTTSGHPPLANHVPLRDATVVARLRAAGAILLGKTHLSELAGDPQCSSPLFGTTNNPWDPGLTSGGSSGGSAVAVALGFSDLDPGSDIGGSIRIPAAYCGVAGLKATENRIPRTGHIPHLPGRPRSVRHLLSFGLLARSVGMLERGFRVLAGPDGVDTEVPPLPHAPAPVLSRPLRFAWWDEFAGLPLCRRTRAGLQRMVQALTEAGCVVERCRPPGFDFEKAWNAYGSIAGAEIGLGLPELQRRLLGLAGRLLPASQPVARAFARGMSFDPVRYNAALNQREELIHELEAFLGEWDAWVCPVAPTVAYPHCRLSPLRPPPSLAVDGQRLPYFEATVSLAVPFSLTGSPVAVLPAGVVEGLPVGLQFIGRRWQDEALLAACAKAERAAGGYVEPPLAREGGVGEAR